jgi:hypothetical protein
VLRQSGGFRHHKVRGTSLITVGGHTQRGITSDFFVSLVFSLTKHPFNGTGKLEPLKHAFASCWFRRINREHRLVYKVADTIVFVLIAKGQYE